MRSWPGGALTPQPTVLCYTDVHGCIMPLSAGSAIVAGLCVVGAPFSKLAFNVRLWLNVLRGKLLPRLLSALYIFHPLQV